MFKFFKQLFCKHLWIGIDEYSKDIKEKIICLKCKKEKYSSLNQIDRILKSNNITRYLIKSYFENKKSYNSDSILKYLKKYEK